MAKVPKALSECKKPSQKNACEKTTSTTPVACPGDRLVPWIGIPLKWFVLAFLVFQNSFAVLIMRFARSGTGTDEWNPQTGVIMQELFKALSCLAFLAKDGELALAFDDKLEFLKAGIPAVLYLVQNNMQYVALDYLNAPTYAVLYQLKILSTAVCSVLLLGRRLGVHQWLALFVLTVGVSCVTLSQLAPSRENDSVSNKHLGTGVSAVLLAAMMSGLAGASIESLLQASKKSLWIRSFQLTLHSVLVGGAVLMLGSDRDEIFKRGFFHGYTWATWVSIANNALGGLLIAVVIKYADSIMKNFSQSLAIVVTAIVSFLCFDAPIRPLFVLGAGMVIYAIFMYGNLVPPLKLLVKTLLHRPHAL